MLLFGFGFRFSHASPRVGSVVHRQINNTTVVVEATGSLLCIKKKRVASWGFASLRSIPQHAELSLQNIYLLSSETTATNISRAVTTPSASTTHIS
jgi:hypothetical protein